MSNLTYSIVNLDAQYTVSQEYSEDWFIRFVVRFNGKFLVSHPLREAAEKLARTHYYIFCKGKV
jgi:hypothetical protein